MGKRVYSVVIGTALGVIKTMKWPVTVYGAENIPSSGGAILASNHIGHLDFVFSGYAARPQGRRVRFLAKKEIFDKRGVGWLMRQMGHIPVDRDGDARNSMALAEDALERGEVIGMFPEGTISPSFIPRPAKTGTVRIAQSAGVPLLPVAVWGTQRILTKWRPRNFKRGIPIVVNVGPAMELPADEDPAVATARMMDAIKSLLAQAQAKYPAQPSGKSDRWWVPAHLGGDAPTYEHAERLLDEERERRRKRREEKTKRAVS